MLRFILAALIGLGPQLALSQENQSPFTTMMGLAKVKSIIQVDTVAGITKMLLSSSVEDPRFVFVFAPGGEGAVDFSANPDGLPISSRPRNPAFTFALEFLKRQVAWAIIAVPENYGATVSPQQRLDKQHIDAVAHAGQRIREAYPKAKLILIGHSNGGVTAGMQAIQSKPAFDAIVMSAPNLEWLQNVWKPEQARVPIMFITHKHDNCKSTAAFKTVYMAGDKFPIVVIESPSSGSWNECRTPPAPHFFTDVYGEYADAILKWAAAL